VTKIIDLKAILVMYIGSVLFTKCSKSDYSTNNFEII